MTEQNNKIFESVTKLRRYCEKEGFQGWDPYDGLNSVIFQYSPFKYSYHCRLAWIQAFKRNPINLRVLLLVKKDYNAKGLGLLLSAYCNLYQAYRNREYLNTINYLAAKLGELKTNGYSGACWGYNFDWQSRLAFMPAATPTVVATSFVAYSLMDAFDCTENDEYLQLALSSCRFISHDLNRTRKKHGFIFSYSPLDHMRVYNASFLGSRLLARAYGYCQDDALLDLARESVIACTEAQRSDGAWKFGEDDVQSWVDSFHTGYKLESISEYQKYSGDYSFNDSIIRGMDYYLSHFFLTDGTPKYYDNRTYPIDIHCPAQLTATLSRAGVFFHYIELIDRVLEWVIDRMQHDQKGYFYYQLNKGISSRIPYMRWGQAWMLYGMSFYLKECAAKQVVG